MTRNNWQDFGYCCRLFIVSSLKIYFMKFLIPFILSGFVFFTSCQKCYECELYENGQLKDTESFCGSNEEADTLEAAGYTCSAQ
jgi:hypothetical protein